MIDLEDAAKHAKLGLWGLPEHQRLPPWEFRTPEKKMNVIECNQILHCMVVIDPSRTVKWMLLWAI